MTHGNMLANHTPPISLYILYYMCQRGMRTTLDIIKIKSVMRLHWTVRWSSGSRGVIFDRWFAAFVQHNVSENDGKRKGT